MKLLPSLALAATLLLNGCSIFQRSPTWDLVVRGNTSGGEVSEGKGGYINRMHQLLAGAGVEHKIVTYQYHWLNAYREEAIQAGVLIIYRDDTTPNNPWWITDEYRHTPVWVPNKAVEDQVGFFIQQRAEIVSVQEFAGAAPSGKQQLATVSRRQQRELAQVRSGRASRTLFAEGREPRLSVAKKKVAVRGNAKPSAPRPALVATDDAQAAALFRSKHGTAYDAHSSVDREKMNQLRRRLFARNQIVGLRPE